jgi:hypothetical protein
MVLADDERRLAVGVADILAVEREGEVVEVDAVDGSGSGRQRVGGRRGREGRVEDEGGGEEGGDAADEEEESALLSGGMGRREEVGGVAKERVPCRGEETVGGDGSVPSTL